MNVETSSRSPPAPVVTPLQWSHVLMNVETAPFATLNLGSTLLQWSHVLMNVETSSHLLTSRA